MKPTILAVATLAVFGTVANARLGQPAARAQQAQDIDWEKARALRQRVLRGEKLSPEDRAYYERAVAEFGRRNGNRPAAGAPPPRESTGMPPLTDLGEGKYKGETGGLYGNGKNEPPKAHLEAAMRAAAEVRPLDAEGRPSPAGKVVLLAMGMSNTTQEFSSFMQLAAGEPKSPNLVIVDGAQGGQAAEQWNDANRRTWQEAERRLQAAGVTPKQVQVVWLKQALIQQGQFGEFPAHAKRIADAVAQNLKLAKEQYPNLKLAYLSSRIYGGFATTALNPEPYAYEGAYAMRWLIERQIKGEAELSPPKAPVLLWGPYLWADGVKGRKADSLVWTREDFGPDGTHPSPSGRRKVAELLLKFFKTDATARPWFSGRSTAAR